jgi:uncharacterized membrane protein YhaH (DUF805 family)
MTYGEAVWTCFKKFFTFAGRARRAEFWYFQLLFAICALMAVVFDINFNTAEYDENGVYDGGVILGLTVIAFFFPLLSVSVRRLHDIDRSGWWWWLSLIPLLGGLILLVRALRKGTEGPNTYGPDPLDPDSVSVFD